jgi:curved DNA-binding protein CbpA
MPRRPRFDKDYYRIMGLHPEATEDEIRRAYRRLALEWHPDRRQGDAQATEKFKEISEAYAVLIDASRRRQYDGARRGTAPGAFRADREDLFRDLFADPRASAIFEDLAREFARVGLRVDRQSFHQTLFGGRAVVTGGVFVISAAAPALAFLRLARALVGSRASEPPRPLPGARGVLGTLGRVGRWLLGRPAPALAGGDVTMPLMLTPAEAERGGRKRVVLDAAHGAGEVLVTIPPGVRPGTRLRLRGRGPARSDGGRGDVYLAIEIPGHA